MGMGLVGILVPVSGMWIGIVCCTCVKLLYFCLVELLNQLVYKCLEIKEKERINSVCVFYSKYMCTCTRTSNYF